MSSTLIALFILGASLAAQAQTPLRFEVASVKPSAPNQNSPEMNLARGQAVRIADVALRDIDSVEMPTPN